MSKFFGTVYQKMAHSAAEKNAHAGMWIWVDCEIVFPDAASYSISFICLSKLNETMVISEAAYVLVYFSVSFTIWIIWKYIFNF